MTTSPNTTFRPSHHDAGVVRMNHCKDPKSISIMSEISVILILEKKNAPKERLDLPERYSCSDPGWPLRWDQVYRVLSGNFHLWADQFYEAVYAVMLTLTRKWTSIDGPPIASWPDRFPWHRKVPSLNHKLVIIYMSININLWKNEGLHTPSATRWIAEFA